MLTFCGKYFLEWIIPVIISTLLDLFFLHDLGNILFIFLLNSPQNSYIYIYIHYIHVFFQPILESVILNIKKFQPTDILFPTNESTIFLASLHIILFEYSIFALVGTVVQMFLVENESDQLYHNPCFDLSCVQYICNIVWIHYCYWWNIYFVLKCGIIFIHTLLFFFFVCFLVDSFIIFLYLWLFPLIFMIIYVI